MRREGRKHFYYIAVARLELCLSDDPKLGAIKWGTVSLSLPPSLSLDNQFEIPASFLADHPKLYARYSKDILALYAEGSLCSVLFPLPLIISHRIKLPPQFGLNARSCVGDSG